MVPRTDDNLARMSRSPRSDLDPSIPPQIDLALKALRNYSRTLTAVLESWQHETKILERLYYKGNNQHRSAIFWQKSVEMRRHGTRLNGLNLSSTFVRLRESFYSEAASQDPKLLKASWTHFPSGVFLLSILKRLSGAVALSEKTLERLSVIYRCYTLAMESGYFIQLVLTLAAICSRMNALLLDMQPTLQSSCQSIFQLLVILHPNVAQEGRRLWPHFSDLNTRAPIAAMLLSSLTSSDAPDDDLGRVVSRPSRTHANVVERESWHTVSLSATTALDVGAAMDASASVSTLQTSNTESFPVRVQPAESTGVGPRHTSKSVIAASSSTLSSSVVKVVKKKSRETDAGEESSRSKQVKKRRTKKDDIDAIFGF